MATTITGFVRNISAGRAGLFTATIQSPGQNATVTVQVSDLDGEPERFNERLIKTRILRDAMDWAEPVEVKYVSDGKTGNEVEEVKRISRDDHHGATASQEFVGFVIALRVQERTTPNTKQEAPDVAVVRLLDPSTQSTIELSLSLQLPERAVSAAILEIIRDAMESGQVLRLNAFSTDGEKDALWIYTAEVPAMEKANLVVDGFVESIGIRLVQKLAYAEIFLRTSSPLIGPGRVADPTFFKSDPVVALVARKSPMLDLLRQALSKGERVRLGLLLGKGKGNDGKETFAVTNKGAMVLITGDDISLGADPGAQNALTGLLLGAVVMAPLASALRPVWVRVRRISLDGPSQAECRCGVPSSDLGMGGVAELQVPHRAAWEGEGCFNRGIYRFQIVSPVPIQLFIDGVEVPCVKEIPFVLSDLSKEEKADNRELDGAAAEELLGSLRSDDASLPENKARLDARLGMNVSDSLDYRLVDNCRQKIRYSCYLAHSCMENHHTVRVEVNEWRCGYKFLIDVFKLR